MDFKGQTTVLSAIIVLAGMMFLFPAITKKALAIATLNMHATATCASFPGQNHPCQFTLVSKNLEKGEWTSPPSESGTVVTWSTKGICTDFCSGITGSVTYKVTGGVSPQYSTAVLYFHVDPFGFNKCRVSGMAGAGSGTCKSPVKGSGDFTYNLVKK